MTNEQVSHGSLSQFIQSISTMSGDLSNITAPPFVLADKSTTEFPRYWIEHPDLFCAPANESDPGRRMLAVLKWFLSSLKGQQYAGRDPNDGIKKPLNAFLGEVFVGECGPEDDPTCLISEQVSHHPPVTACYLWNDKHGVRAEGFTRQEITFRTSVNIKQIGYAVLHIDQYEEDYLIPLPSIKVKGILTGGPYPELVGHYSIVSSSGYVAEIDFEGKGMLGFGGEKNHLRAKVYTTNKEDSSSEKKPLFSAEGCWSSTFDIKDDGGKLVEKYDGAKVPSTEFRTADLDAQDPWESRKAWKGVIEGVQKGNMKMVVDQKSSLENAQRQLRKQPETSEEKWEALYFRKEKDFPTADALLKVLGQSHSAESTKGCWRFAKEQSQKVQKPWRGKLTPHG